MTVRNFSLVIALKATDSISESLVAVLMRNRAVIACTYMACGYVNTNISYMV